MPSKIEKAHPGRFLRREWRLSIGVKLSAAFLVLVFLLIMSAAWSYQSLRKMELRYDWLLEETYPVALTAKELHAEMLVQAQQIMAFAATRDVRAVRAIEESQARANQHLIILTEAGQFDETVGLLVEEITAKRSIFNRMLDAAVQNSDSIEQYQLVLTADNARNMGNALGLQIADLVAHLQEQVRLAQDQSRQASRAAAAVLLTLGLVSVALGVFISVVTYRLVALPLRDLAGQLSRIAAGTGDLTQQLHVRSRDEIGMLGESVNQLVAGLADMVRRLIASSEEIYARCRDMTGVVQDVTHANNTVSSAMAIVAEGSQEQAQSCETASYSLSELNHATEQIAGGAQHQAARVQETTQTVHQMVSAMEAMASTVAQMNATSHQTASQAQQGARIVDDTLEGMHRIRDRVMGAAERVQELGQYGSHIGEMLQVITDIADQTNLLALNAAIEAARAGNQGRGFAVVAEEVRRLAERSASSVKGIRDLVNSIQAGTQLAVSAITESTRDVEQGVQLSNAAGAALNQILQAVDETTGGIREIHRSIEQMLGSARVVSESVQEMAAVTEENSAASEEMAAGGVQVSQAMDDLTRVSHANRQAVDQVSASMGQVTGSVGRIGQAVHELTEIAETLRGLVAQFKV